MKRTIGFLMMVGLMVGVVGCGDDDNPVKSNQANQDLLVGTWIDQDGDEWTLKADGTFVDYAEDKGTWSLVEDQFKLTYDDPDFAVGNVVTSLISVTDTKLTTDEDDNEGYVYTRKT